MIAQTQYPPTAIRQLGEGMFMATWGADSPLLTDVGGRIRTPLDPARVPATITVVAMQSDLYTPSFISDAPTQSGSNNGWSKERRKDPASNYPNRWLVDTFKPRGNLLWTHASYFNLKNRVSEKHSSQTIIGKARGPKGTQYLSLPVPEKSKKAYGRVHYADGTYFGCGPILSIAGVARFTDDMLNQRRFRFTDPITPGELNHMEHPNQRVFSVYPARHSSNNYFMAVVITTVDGVAQRGQFGQGASGPATSRLAAHYDGLNENPGFAINHDGGPIANLTVVDRQGAPVAVVRPNDYYRSSTYVVFSKTKGQIKPEKKNVPRLQEKVR